MGILSIQSQVAAGFVGNSAAAFALQRLGRQVWPVPTVLLSHHPGHGGAEGGVLPADLLARVLNGLVARGCLGQTAAVLSGYLGHEDNAGLVTRAVALAKPHGAIYLCDPVLGDDGRLYVRREIVGAMHNLAAKADIVTPNAFELAVLSGHEIATQNDALHAMRALQAKGPPIVVLSSFKGAGTLPGTLDVLALDGAAAWRLAVPERPGTFRGAGDLFAALFLNAWLDGRNAGLALGLACDALQEVLAKTNGADELCLIESQSLFAAPERRFFPERIS